MNKHLLLDMPEGFEVRIDFSEQVVTDRAALANGNTRTYVDCGCGGGDCVCH